MKMALWTHIPRVAPEKGTKFKIANLHCNGLFEENPWVCLGRVENLETGSIDPISVHQALC